MTTTELTKTNSGGEVGKRPTPPDEDKLGLRELLGKEDVRARLRDVLGAEAGVFASSILSVYSGSEYLQRCTPKSILNAGFQAATVKLPVIPALGYAAIVPYCNNKKGIDGKWTKVWEAGFQVQWKGVVQLALRTGQYKRINLAPVYEGQLISYDQFKGVVKIDASKKLSDHVVGFYFYFSLATGYEREGYWSVVECVRHGYKYSKSFQAGNGQWVEDSNIKAPDGKFDIAAFCGWLHEKSGTYNMAAKTVVKMDLQKWGILSADMQKAFIADQAVIDDEGRPKYIDSTATDAESLPAGEEKKPEPPKRASEAKKEAAAAAAESATGNGIKEVTGPIEKMTTREMPIEGKDTPVDMIYIAGTGYYTADKAVGALARKEWKSGHAIQEIRFEGAA